MGLTEPASRESCLCPISGVRSTPVRYTRKGDTCDKHHRLFRDDNDARLTFYVLLWKRRGITLEQFDDYWRDVHGPVCARLPGQFQYLQYHVADNEGGFFPAAQGVESRLADEDQFDGIAELTFRSISDRQAWIDASTILMADEHNLFRKAIGYITALGNSRTLIDGIELGDPNGSMGGVKFHVLVRKADRVGLGDFRRDITEQFGPAAAASPHVLKFRFHLFEPLDTGRPEAAGVVHDEAPEKQYHAAFEIGFRNPLEREAFFASVPMAPRQENSSKTCSEARPLPRAQCLCVRLQRSDDGCWPAGIAGG